MTTTLKVVRELIKIKPQCLCDQYGCRETADYAALTTKITRFKAEGSKRIYCCKHANKWAERHGLEMPEEG